MRHLGKACSLAVLSLLLAAPAVIAAPAGTPDPSFGAAGFLRFDEPLEPNETLEDVVVLPDGKILAGGSRGNAKGFLLLQANPDGSLDPAFGSGGISTVPYDGMSGPRSISGIAVRADGRILAAGLGNGVKNAFAFGRFLPDGEPDPSFGEGGAKVVEIGSPAFANDVALAPDGKVVAAGLSTEPKVAAVVRVSELGNPDLSFNAVGFRLVDVAGTGEAAAAVEVLADNSVLIAGDAATGGFLAKLTASGAPAMDFGAGGIAVKDLGANGSGSGGFEDMAVLPDGKILGAGHAGTNPDTEVVVARFTASGDPDLSFAENGVFRHNPTAREDAANAVAVLPDGGIVLAGSRDEGEPGSGETMLLRLTSDGRLDPSFGNGGEAAADVGPGTDRAFGLALQADGKPVVAGFTDEPEIGRVLMLGRFTAFADPPPPTPAETPPPMCGGVAATVVGTAGDDRLRGTKGRDVILAGAGNDRVDTLGADDVVCGGPGADTIRTGPGRDTALGQGGRDVLRGGAGGDDLRGGAGGDRLFGGPGKDRLLGGPGNDRLAAGPGKGELCDGGAGRRDRARAGCERLKRIP